MFGHPPGLRTLFFTELWERLSYYGMRAILVLFLVATTNEGGFGMSAETAGAIYGLYTALVYLSALPGGWVADRLLGQRHAVFAGGCVIAAGHFSMAVPTVPTFYAGLALIVIGTGLLKPNVSAMVGDLYPEGGARRDAGFSVYYMGINLGAFIGPLICGTLGEKINWHLGFSAAGIGMVCGLVQYRLGWRNLANAGLPATTGDRRPEVRRLLSGIVSFAGVVLAFVFGNALGLWKVTLNQVAGATGILIVVLAALYFGFVLVLGRWTRVEKGRIGVIFLLVIGSALFWSGFEQAGSSMNLFAERLTDRGFAGWQMPASWLQSVNPLFIILFAPVFGSLWVWLGSRQPSIPGKFALGLALLGAGFLVIAWGATYASGSARVSPAWLVVTYFLHTSGELCLSPIGLSSVTKLAPRALVGQMMGLWFLGTALGNLMAGLLGGAFESLPLPRLFGSVGLLVLVAGAGFAICRRPIQRLIGDIR